MFGHVSVRCLDKGQPLAFISPMTKWERLLRSRLLGKSSLFRFNMRAALSSLSCFSCLKSRQQECEVDPHGPVASLPLQPTTRRPSERSDIDGLFGMSEGDVTVLPFAPGGPDMPRQEQRKLTRLYCKNGGYQLRISPEGNVSGSRQEDDVYDILILKATSPGVVVIKGQHTERYLAMDKEGHLYGSKEHNDECSFQEKYEENHYNTYRSQKYSWYVGLKKNGHPKPGPTTDLGQKAVLFLPRPV